MKSTFLLSETNPVSESIDNWSLSKTLAEQGNRAQLIATKVIFMFIKHSRS